MDAVLQCWATCASQIDILGHALVDQQIVNCLLVSYVLSMHFAVHFSVTAHMYVVPYLCYHYLYLGMRLSSFCGLSTATKNCNANLEFSWQDL